MAKLYKPILLVCGVFLLGLLMHGLRPGPAAVMPGQVLPQVLLYATGLVLGLLIKPVLE